MFQSQGPGAVHNGSQAWLTLLMLSVPLVFSLLWQVKTSAVTKVYRLPGRNGEKWLSQLANSGGSEACTKAWQQLQRTMFDHMTNVWDVWSGVHVFHTADSFFFCGRSFTHLVQWVVLATHSIQHLNYHGNLVWTHSQQPWISSLLFLHLLSIRF